MNHAVVFVPGIMGCILKLDKQVIWPGSVGDYLGTYGKMAELMREDLVATDVIRDYGIFKQYSSLLEDLEVCGFKEKANPATLFVFAYDWRKSNLAAVTEFAKLIEKVHAAHHGDVTISIIAHSMGGLIARSYLESGKFAGAPFDAVKNLITIGTPHRGATLALTAAAGLEKRLFLSKSQVLQLASDPRYPAVYELLPPRLEPFAWNADEKLKYDPVDVYDPKWATDPGGIGLVAANLDAAAKFRATLDFAKRPAAVRYFSFYGTHQKTGATVYVDRQGGRTRVRALEMDDAGDGTVPVWSGQPNGIQSLPVDGEHGTLFRSDDLRQTLQVLLGVPGKLAAPMNIQLSVSPKVVEPETPLSIVLSFPGGATSITGKLHLDRLIVTNGVETGVTPGKAIDVNYSGGSLDRMSLSLDAPELTGFYRVVFEADGQRASDDLIVQAPSK